MAKPKNIKQKKNLYCSLAANPALQWPYICVEIRGVFTSFLFNSYRTHFREAFTVSQYNEVYTVPISEFNYVQGLHCVLIVSHR